MWRGLLSHDRRTTLRQLLAGGAILAVAWPRAALAKDPVVYAYDALGRLASAAYPNGVTIIYTYDAAGNRTQVSAGSGPPPPPPLSASASSASWFSGPSGEDPPVQVTTSGGTPPYTYVWQRVSGHPHTFAASPNASATTWYVSGGGSFPPLKTSVWRCLVTDAASSFVSTGDVAVTIDVS